MGCKEWLQWLGVVVATLFILWVCDRLSRRIHRQRPDSLPSDLTFTGGVIICMSLLARTAGMEWGKVFRWAGVVVTVLTVFGVCDWLSRRLHKSDSIARDLTEVGSFVVGFGLFCRVVGIVDWNELWRRGIALAVMGVLVCTGSRSVRRFYEAKPNATRGLVLLGALVFSMALIFCYVLVCESLFF